MAMSKSRSQFVRDDRAANVLTWEDIRAAKRAKREEDQAALKLAVDAGAAAPGAAAPDPEWQYEDASQQLQGPFPLGSMQEWFAGGFLPLGTRVRRGTGEEFLELRHVPEIVGTKADGEGAARATAAQLKAAGNAHMAAGRLTEAIAAYGSALELAPAGDDDTLRAALLSNRSGAHLLNDAAEAATADARLCIEARPEWPKAHYRLSAARTAAKDFSGALAAADKAERLDATPAHAEAKRAAVDLLKKEVQGMEQGADRENKELLLQKFRDPTGDSEIRQRRKQEAQKVVDAAAKHAGNADADRLDILQYSDASRQQTRLDALRKGKPVSYNAHGSQFNTSAPRKPDGKVLPYGK